ncbi:universal stress protein [Microbaculum marinisediminis]|uniref:Universal stress protein n=1 Tax=Microbaculum marinisediminis TaxID=2931392 RepID=A0AAW5QX73_9HYPH|nr:universal stress protein [Microbaculum sp. A6E488]MCT8971577.1 universal stress protein [Microbaculum sp. A6E488]
MFKTILVPIDLAEPDSSGRALNAAIQMARDYDATMHVVTVVPDMGMSIVGGYFPEGFEQKALDETKARLKAYLEDLVPGDVMAKGHVMHGGIYEQILQIADQLSADLIVMASHRPAMRDYLLGPNAARVVRHAKQSVLVVRE